MKFGKIFQKIAAVLLSIITLMMCGCSVRFGTTPQDGDVVAKPRSNSSEDMEITYGEFNQQYLYFLKTYGIEDDTSGDYAEACKQQRQTIINSLILNKICLKKAEELNVSELTEKELAQVKEDLEDQFKEQAEYYGKKALGVGSTGGSSDNSSGSSSDSSSGSSSDAPSYTNEEILARGYEELDKMLSECGITRDDLQRWNEEFVIVIKVMDEIVKDITREAAEERAAKQIATLEDMYSENRDYYFQAGYDNLWVPEGSRRIKHVLLGFDQETLTRIQALRKDGKDDEADALRTEKAEELSEKIQQVEKLLDDNVDFNTILVNYSADANTSSLYPDGYLVSKDDTGYVKEFSEAAFVPEKPGDRTRCTSDYGVHIMIYVSDAKPDEDEVKKFTDTVYTQLCQEAAEKKTSEWEKEYDYEIDREKLRIEDQSSSSVS